MRRTSNDGIVVPLRHKGWHYSGYCNPEVDKLIDQQSAEPDREKRKQLVWQIERRLAEERRQPIIFYPRGATCTQTLCQRARDHGQQHLTTAIAWKTSGSTNSLCIPKMMPPTDAGCHVPDGGG